MEENDYFKIEACSGQLQVKLTHFPIGHRRAGQYMLNYEAPGAKTGMTFTVNVHDNGRNPDKLGDTGKVTKEYQINGSGVALIVFAWNFWKEISERLVSQLSGIKGLHEIVCILPFPQPRIVRLALHGNGAVVEKGSVTTLTDLKFPFVVQN